MAEAEGGRLLCCTELLGGFFERPDWKDKMGYDPNQPRNEQGEWSDEGLSSAGVTHSKSGSPISLAAAGLARGEAESRGGRFVGHSGTHDAFAFKSEPAARGFGDKVGTDHFKTHAGHTIVYAKVREDDNK